MMQAIKEHVIVKKGGVIELHLPELTAGTEAEVIIMIEQAPQTLPDLSSFIGKAKGCFSNSDEIDTFLRKERDKWE